MPFSKFKIKEECGLDDVATNHNEQGNAVGSHLSSGNIATGPLPPGPMDSPFMQQQSQIFVFSTSMANRAAEAVRAGLCKSIREFHTNDHPGSKQFSQKMPMMKAEPSPDGIGLNISGTGSVGLNGGIPKSSPINETSMSSIEQWVRQQNDNLQRGNFTSPSAPLNNFSPSGPNFPPPNTPGSQGAYDCEPPSGLPSNLMQNKVPNENLTPEQLQRREDKIASLRKLEQMLSGNPGGGVVGPNGDMVGPHPGQASMMVGGMPHMTGPPGGMSQSGPIMTGPGQMMNAQCPMSGPGPIMGPGGLMLNSPGQMLSGSGPGMAGPPGMMTGLQMNAQFGPRGPNVDQAQREWMKLQQEHFLEKSKKESMERFRFYQQMQNRMLFPNEGRHFQQMQGPGPMGPFPNDVMHFQQMGHVPIGPFPGEGLLPPHRNGGPMPMIHRAGNPEQFSPDPMNHGGPVANKPPPPYTHSKKRKLSNNDNIDEVHKRLQPAPSPKQFSYLNQFEGQELTITKQLNTAYQDCTPAPPTPVKSENPSQTKKPNKNHQMSNTNGPPSVSVTGGNSNPSTPQAMQVQASTAVSNVPVSCSSAPPSSNMPSPAPGNTMSTRPSSVSGISAQHGGNDQSDRSQHTVETHVKSPQVANDSVLLGSPSFSRPSSNPVCNANVQIQAKTPNTIQYLPAVPPSSMPGPMAPSRSKKDIDHMPNQFPNTPSQSHGMGAKGKGGFPAGNGPMMLEVVGARMPGPGMIGPGMGPQGPMIMPQVMMPNNPMMSQHMSFQFGPGSHSRKEMEAMSRLSGPPNIMSKGRGMPQPVNPQMMMDFNNSRMPVPGMMGPSMGPHGPMSMQSAMMPNNPMMGQPSMNHFHYGPCAPGCSMHYPNNPGGMPPSLPDRPGQMTFWGSSMDDLV